MQASGIRGFNSYIEEREMPPKFKFSLSPIAVLIFVASFSIAGSAQTFTTLASFDGTNGKEPIYVAPIQGLDGNLYATTSAGGTHSDGNIFQVTTAGKITTVYSFCSLANCDDGSSPYESLLLTPSGYLYGNTLAGGTSGDGTAFKLSGGGKLTVLENFDATNGDGSGGAFIQASNGNFYSVEAGGGMYGDGLVYEITQAGTFLVLQYFDEADGQYPNGSLVQSSNGVLYGSTRQGGSSGDGAIYDISTARKPALLYSFTGGADGNEPHGPLILASNGELYSTTIGGGAHSNGTIFRATQAGKETVVYSFCALANCADGSAPYYGVMQATDGNFYGTTSAGGAHGDGTIFKLTPQGKLTTLYSFCSNESNEICLDGSTPYGGLVQATDGNLYGLTYSGGTDNDGSVYRVSLGLNPFVETVTNFGKVDAKIILLGTDLTGTSAVSFNGTSATFTADSATEITTTVPAGATTGTITVTTPGGALASNLPFRVTPQVTSFFPTSGTPGTSVTITGVSLTQASHVSFGGVTAEFTVNSDTQITATVPTGAVTGKIDVTTPGGNATSATSFTVN
jgi:uncharacterized repeat protein (TIGR03803 family)